MSYRICLHVWVVRSPPTLWGDPDDILGRVLDVTGLAVNAVLRVDLEAVGAVAVFHEFVHARRTVAAFGARVFREVQADGETRVPENAVAGLVLLVVRIGGHDRGGASVRELAVGLRIISAPGLLCGSEAPPARA